MLKTIHLGLDRHASMVLLLFVVLGAPARLTLAQGTPNPAKKTSQVTTKTQTTATPKIAPAAAIQRTSATATTVKSSVPASRLNHAPIVATQTTTAVKSSGAPVATPKNTSAATPTITATTSATSPPPPSAPAAIPANAGAGAGALIPVNPGVTPAAAEEVDAVSAISAPVLDPTATTVGKAPVPAVPVTRGTAPPAAQSAPAMLTPPLLSAQQPTSDTTTDAAPPALASAATTGTMVGESSVAPPSALESIRPAPTNRAPYLREHETIGIFDKGRGEELTPLQRAAQLLSESRERKQRRSLANIQNLVTYEYALSGADPSQMRDEAIVRALKSAAGRLYFENYILLGRDLLEPYLRQYGKPFIARATVLEHHTMARDRVAERIRVSVNLDSLYKDLQEKHFIAEPNLRPTVGIFLQEIVSGQADTSAGGRGRIERVMEDNLFQPHSNLITGMPLDQDLSTSAGLLKAARDQAQRQNIDVMITGTLSIRPVSQEQIFYDQYSFQEADLNLKMYRVDTGELLDEVRDRYSASSENASQSVKRVLDIMLTRATQKLSDRLGKLWENTLLNQGHYRLMISGVDRNGVAGVYNLIKTLAPGTQVYEKSYYGDVLVVHVVAPNETADQVEMFLRKSSEPQLSVRRVDKHRFIVNIL